MTTAFETTSAMHREDTARSRRVQTWQIAATRDTRTFVRVPVTPANAPHESHTTDPLWRIDVSTHIQTVS
jgi:hypothetical protein